MNNLIKLIADYSKLSKEDQELFITVLTSRHVINKEDNNASIDAFKKSLEGHANKIKQKPPYISDPDVYPFYPGSPPPAILPYRDPLKRNYDIICNSKENPSSNIRGNFEL